MQYTTQLRIRRINTIAIKAFLTIVVATIYLTGLFWIGRWIGFSKVELEWTAIAIFIGLAGRVSWKLVTDYLAIRKQDYDHAMLGSKRWMELRSTKVGYVLTINTSPFVQIRHKYKSNDHRAIYSFDKTGQFARKKLEPDLRSLGLQLEFIGRTPEAG